MSAHVHRIIHQQAQVTSLETCYSNFESQTIVLMSKFMNYETRSPTLRTHRGA